MEHTPIDGHTILRLLTEIHNEILARNGQVLVDGPSVAPPRRLDWIVPVGSSVSVAIHDAKVHAEQLIAKTDSSVLIFDQFGQKKIVERNVSPDGFVQMAYQLAYYKLYKKPASTYESVQMKQYYHGRTECLRSVTNASLHFTKTFSCPRATREKKEEALRQAIGAHVKRAKECKEARGVDRHFLGLRLIARQKEQWYPGFVMPEIFNDPSYSKLFASVLSTSNCGTRALDLFGFGPVVDNGFGLGYMIHPEAIHVCVTNFHGQASAFAKALQESFIEMLDTLRAAPKHLKAKM